MFLLLSIVIFLQLLTGNVEALCDKEMCTSNEYDCSQPLPGCTSKKPVALCEKDGVYYCVLKKPKTGGPVCPICDSLVFDCSVKYSSGKCNPKLTEAVCADSLDDQTYYCVQLKLGLPTTTKPLTTLPPSTKLPTTLPPSTKLPTTLPPSTKLPTTLPPSTKLPTTLPPSTKLPTTLSPSTKPPTTPPPSNKPETTTNIEPSTTAKPEVKTTPSPIPGIPGHRCGNKFPEITPLGPTVCLPGTDQNACPAPVFMHAPLFDCVPGAQCCVMEPVTTTLPTTTVLTTTPAPTTTTLTTTTTPSPTPGQPGQICGNKYPEITPPGLILCLPGTNEKACPAPVFTYAPLFECVSGYQCCSMMQN